MSSITTPKITDVARIAGVSTATVSRALSKPDTVATATREAVLDAAEKSGYRINLAARNLRKRRTGAIVILVPNLGNPFFSQILAGIESTLAQNGLSVLMVDTEQTQSRQEFIFEYLHNSRADGVIALDGSLPSEILKNAQSSAGNLPIVFACEWHKHDQYPSIRSNNEQGTLLAIQHLVELGHQRIGFINGPKENVLSPARRNGTISALNKFGIPHREQWFFDGDFSINSGVEAAKSWLQLEEKPTGIFCANDEAAFGLISELHENGINVPQHVSVIGFDDIEISQRYIPPLTTIWQPRLDLGTQAAEMLITRIENADDSKTPPLKILPVELIERKSTAKPFSGPL